MVMWNGIELFIIFVIGWFAGYWTRKDEDKWKNI